MQLRGTLGRRDLDEHTCGTCRLPGTAVDSPDLTSFGSVVAISHLCSLCGARAIDCVPGPGLPTGMLPEVGPSDRAFRSWSATCIKYLQIRQERLQPDLSCSLCYLLCAIDPPLRKYRVPHELSCSTHLHSVSSTHLHSIKWFLSIISVREMKNLLTPFHTRETVTQEAQVCRTYVRRVPNVRGMGMDFETTRCYSEQPADFACIAEGCFLLSFIFCFQTTHLLFLAFSTLHHFVLLPVQAPSYFTSIYPLPYSFSLTLSQGFNFHCCFLAQLT